jgi:hypothetical protein
LLSTTNIATKRIGSRVVVPESSINLGSRVGSTANLEINELKTTRFSLCLLSTTNIATKRIGSRVGTGVQDLSWTSGSTTDDVDKRIINQTKYNELRG